MEINTRDFGVIEIEKDALFDFPEGVYGFEEDTCFALFHKTFDGIPFLYLQSVQNVIPCFLVFSAAMLWLILIIFSSLKQYDRGPSRSS
jgi:flagellar assembly factor FliW